MELTVREFFEALNSFIPVCMNILAVPTGMMLGFWIVQRFVKAIKLAVELTDEPETESGKKKSYEEEMTVYDNETVQPLILPTSLSLEDLLSEDGEIPDRFIQG